MNKEQKKKLKEALEEKEYWTPKEISELAYRKQKVKKMHSQLATLSSASCLSIAIFFIRSSFTIKDNL